MDFINLLLADMPSGFWQNLIGYVVDFVTNYGLAIIIFSIVLKIILSPLDFMQRKTTRDNTEKQAKLKPQLDKLNAKYKDKKEILNQKTMELYKKENYNIIGSCFGMLINLVLTLVIFITLFGAMRNISEFKLANQYTQLETTYQTAYDADFDINSDILLATQAGQTAVLSEYENVKEGFLWINNIWMPDTSASVIPSYSSYLKLSNTPTESAPTEDRYNEVMGVLQSENNGWNGLYILIILAGAVTYISQKVMQGKKKVGETKDPATPQMNTGLMLYLLPILMIVFTISYSAAFALYIVINSLMTMFIAMISNKILDNKEAKKQLDTKPNYSR
ncbi:MAG: YidC/Oxa1 family membrane protein insertase [Clostridia bacterium]|nr:YidC/Oxa1 family membrane protein insertase [Clostridia bacterium]